METVEKVRNMFKINDKNTRMASLISFWCFYRTPCRGRKGPHSWKPSLFIKGGGGGGGEFFPKKGEELVKRGGVLKRGVPYDFHTN